MFDEHDHYWLVASTGQLWSSAAGAYVEMSSSDFIEWMMIKTPEGIPPTPCDDVDDLREKLQFYGLPTPA